MEAGSRRHRKPWRPRHACLSALVYCPLPIPLRVHGVPMAVPTGVEMEYTTPSSSALPVAMPASTAAEPRAKPSKNCGGSGQAGR